MSPKARQDIIHGTLSQILDASKTHSKAILAEDIPMPDGVSALPTLHSDVIAWNYTVDQPWCGRRWEMPRSALKWGTASIGCTFTSLDTSLNGFATYIEVKVGTQLVIIGTPPQELGSLESFKCLLRSRGELGQKPAEATSFELFPLRAGCGM